MKILSLLLIKLEIRNAKMNKIAIVLTVSDSTPRPIKDLDLLTEKIVEIKYHTGRNNPAKNNGCHVSLNLPSLKILKIKRDSAAIVTTKSGMVFV